MSRWVVHIRSGGAVLKIFKHLFIGNERGLLIPYRFGAVEPESGLTKLIYL